MAETTMRVGLLAYTQLTKKYKQFAVEIPAAVNGGDHPVVAVISDGQVVGLTAIRTCYSHLDPSQIVTEEGERYFGKAAADGEGGSDADRLCRRIVSSGHTSTLEHINFTYTIEGVSRALLAQLTRHRHASFSVQSQRYVRLGSADKSGGFDYVVPEKVTANDAAYGFFLAMMDDIQSAYDNLRALGVPPEDARAILPNAAATNLTMTMNLRALLDFYGKRRKGRGAQQEITELAEALRREVVAVEPWTERFFEQA